jgi:RNA recognition motif-containing protein
VGVRLFVGNLPYAATEADVRTHFAAVAAPSQIVMPVDRETGRPRGFAFVEFQDRGQAEEAIRRFDGRPFQGRNLVVNEARAREDRASAPPRPFGPRPGGFAPGAPPSTEPGGARPKPEREFGPPAPPKGKRPPAKWQKGERGPKGPIPIKQKSRVYSIDDESPDEEPIDFEDFATSAKHDETEEESEE